jgi:mono/diheme cytochrome c family protein
MHRRATIAAVGLSALASLATGGEPLVPWPSGQAPSEAHVAQLVADALDLRDLERFEEYLEAWEKGEDSEHFLVRQEDIDGGAWDVDDLFVFGDALFGHEFRKEDGYADVAATVPFARVHDGPRGGIDTFSCAGCHSVGGPDGAGAATQNAFLFGDGDRLDTTLARNPPHALGLGFVQALAREMSDDLSWAVQQARDAAAATGQPVTVPLLTKDVSFGEVVVRPDGGVDTAALQGIDADLVVKPLGWKGNFVDIRRVTEDAARVHFGIQSHVLTERHQDAPDPAALGPGPDWFDPDADGKARELEEGTLTAVAVYLAAIESPVILPPHDDGLRDRWARGSAVFDEVGCDDCHRRSLTLLSTRWEEWPDTTGADPFEVDLIRDGEGPKSGNDVALFSDLKRHAMGPELADPHFEERLGVPTDVWLTRPLWGLAETAPYLHDGRAATIPEAIEAHGGEATASRDAFLALSDDDRANLHVFLLSLSRAPKVMVPL